MILIQNFKKMKKLKQKKNNINDYNINFNSDNGSEHELMNEYIKNAEDYKICNDSIINLSIMNLMKKIMRRKN